jgi:uncharacterized Zn finger protein
MSRYYDGWAPYVSVAERRAQAEREVANMRTAGQSVAPVIITGRKIATTFWGKAWCENLESYQDFESRLPRGRSYVRNSAVLDLQIAPLAVTAMVSGSSIYRVMIDITAAAEPHWQSICRDCAGGIDSLVELLQGRFSKAVMERICRQDIGLFPRPAEIKFSCSCPDFAYMCKHVAAVLYGVGARLDEQPELLFRLRAVDENDLLAGLNQDAPLSMTAPDAGKMLEVDDISALFGLEMALDAPPAAPKAAPPKKAGNRLDPVAPDKTRSAKPVAKQAETKPAAAKRGRPAKPAASAPKPVKGAEVPTLSAPAPAPAKAKRKKAPSAAPNAPYELTPDGYVKWWK